MKRVLYNILILACSMLIFTSCKKNEQYVTHEKTSVEGVLLSAADRSPISNGKVLLLSDEKGEWGDAIWYGRWYSTRNTLITDAQGRFSYSFKHSDDTVYAIAAEADGFFPNINSGGYAYPHWRATGLEGVQKGYKNYYDRPDDDLDFIHNKGVVHYPEIRLAPEGWVKLNLFNEPPTHQNDILQISTEASSESVRFSGASVNTSYIAGPLMAGRYSRILYSISSQGDFEFHEDSVFIEPHDTTMYELTY